MKKEIFFKMLLATSLSSLLVSCSSKEMTYSDEALKFKSLNKSILANYKNAQVEEGVYYYQKLILEDNDFSDVDYMAQRALSKPFTMEADGVSLKSILLSLRKEMPELNVVIDISEETGKQKTLFSFYQKPIYDVLKTIERVGDLDISLKNNTLFIRDKIIIQGNLSAALSAASKSVESKVMSNIETNLKNVLGDKAKIIIDKETGTYYIEAKPNAIRRGKNMIETILNQSSTHALLTFNIYKVNNERNREFGLNTELLLDQITKISLGSPAIRETPLFSLVADKTEGGTVTPDGLVSMSIKALEDLGIVNSVASSKIMIFNGIVTEIKNEKEIGYWLPGEVSTSYGTSPTDINGTSTANVPYLRENRPTFEKEDVGTVLKIVPKLNPKFKSANLNIEYEESEVYSYEETTWKRDSSASAVVLKKPLKTKNTFNSRVILEDEKFRIVSGSKQRETSFKDSFIPGISAIGTHNKGLVYRDVFIVTKVSFPKRTKIIYVNKKEDW